jgi:gluconate 2-dehydrogenase gamma chain
LSESTKLDRRRFLASAGAVSAASALRIGAPALAGLAQAACSARDEAAAFTVLGDAEAADFAAIAARIIPTTDTPGASEAGVIHFFDLAFSDHMRQSLDFARAGLATMNEQAGRPFSSLDAAAQDALLAEREGEGFFELMRAMTLFGFFAMQEHGGNRDDVGWQVVGFDGGRGAWTYPFGYYDAQVHGGEADDE